MINDFLSSFIYNSNDILDIGAHIGYHSIAYSRINSNANIIAFEPQSKVFELLQENISTNLIKNINAFNLAVANKSGLFSLNGSIPDGLNANTNIEYGTDKALNLGGVSLGKNGEQIKTITIDDLNLKNIDFIKIDVEGAESLVLLGGIESISRHRPVICFESNQKTITKDMRDMFECIDERAPMEILRDMGYTVFCKIPNDNIIAIYN